jgi:hypothetical protein
LVTLDLDHFDEETEIQITAAKSGIDRADAERIVRIVRGLRESGACEFAPTVRGCIIVAKSAVVRGCSLSGEDGPFRELCLDILASESSRVGSRARTAKIKEVLNELIDRHC